MNTRPSTRSTPTSLLSLLLVLGMVLGSAAPVWAAPPAQTDDSLGANNSFGRALPITPGSSYQDTLAPVGDVDWYRFTVDGQGELQVALTNAAPELELTFRIWNADASDITGWIRPLAAGADNTAIVDLPAAGRYYVEVRDNGDNAESAQAYSLQLTFTPAPAAGEVNDSFGAAKPLAFDTPLAATLLPRGDSDWYQVTADGHGQLTVAITQVPANLEMIFRVWTPDARDLTGWIRPLAAGGDNIADVDLPTGGRYTLEVRDNGDDARAVAAYTIAVSFTTPADTFEPNDTFGLATPLAIGSTVQGNILPRGDSDWYRLQVNKHGELQVAITQVAPDLDIHFRVWNADVRDITGWIAPLAKGGDTTGVVDLPAPGEYTLEVRDGGDDARSTQAYELRTSFTEAVDPFEPNNSFGHATFLGVNRQAQGNILPRGDSDWYLFSVDTQGQLDIALTSVPADMDLSFRVWNAEVRDISGWIRPLAKGGDTRGSIDIPEPGEYTLEVRDGGDDARSIDPYDLSIGYTNAVGVGEPNNTFETATPATLGATLAGNILPQGDTDWYKVDVPTAGELHVLVSHVAPELDIAIRLWNDAKSNVSSWVNPLAAGGNTQGVFPIETPGVYYLEVADSGGNARSIQPYYLTFSMEPIDPTSVVPPAVPAPGQPTAPGTEQGTTPGTGTATGAGEGTTTGGEGTTPTAPGETGTATATIPSGIKIRVSGQAGPQGAELFVSDPEDLEANGARLQIPAGALEEYATIHIGTASQPPQEAPYGLFPAGKYWVLDPDGLEFKVPVTLTLPVPEASAAAKMFVGHWDGQEWSDLGGVPADGLVSVMLDGFSTYGVFCGEFAEYQHVALKNGTSSDFLTLTYLAGPMPDPDTEEGAPEGCPAPYEGIRRWELKTGDSAYLQLRPGLYQVEVAYPTPQPGVANPLMFSVKPGGKGQTITITDEGATSDDPETKLVFAGRSNTPDTNYPPTVLCSATVPDGVPLVNGDPGAASLPSRVVLIGQGAPVKAEQFPPNGPGIKFTARADEPEKRKLVPIWTVRSSTGNTTIRGDTVDAGSEIADQTNFMPGTNAGRYTVFLTVYDPFGLFAECRWVIDSVRNDKPKIDVFTGRVHVEFGRLDEERADVGLIPPVLATLRPGMTAPLPVTLPNGTTAIWNGLTLCPAAIAGPFTELPLQEQAVTAPAPVDTLQSATQVPGINPGNPPAANTTNLWNYPGRTCVWALTADANLDPLVIQWEFPGPIFGSGTYFAATDVPAGFSEDAPAGILLGAFLRTAEQLRAYNGWVSFLYNNFGVIPAVVWEGWDDPCPVNGPNPCPSAISGGGVENMVANVTDTFVKPALYDYSPVEVGPEAVEPSQCSSVLFFSELRPNPADPSPFQGVQVTARLSSLTQECPIRFIVNGTDGYFVDTTIPSNKDGSAEIWIPGAREGIVDTVIAEVCRGPMSDLATPPPADQACQLQDGTTGWVLRIEVQYTF